MPKKEVIYQGLADLDVIIEDESESSPDYFRVTKLNPEFTAGVNIFKFKGDPSLFDEDTPVYIEILDSNEEPIYYETDVDRQSAEQTAIVSVYVNEDTAPGPGVIILCSTLSNDIDGFPLDKSEINLRWSKEIYIDTSLRSTDEIIFAELPEVIIGGGLDAAPYTYLGYENDGKFYAETLTDLEYYYINDTAVLVTSSITPIGFDGTWQGGTVEIAYENLSNFIPPNGVVDTTTGYTASITSFQGDGIAFLSDPIRFNIINSNTLFQPESAKVLSADFVIEQSASLPSQVTENTFNYVRASFSNLTPQVGQVARIRAYYRSTGLGEYVLVNETDITDRADEFGFTTGSVTIAFPIETVQRNDRLDFKFEFINPVGMVARQVVESLNNLFLGGNTYIGGDDNLLTGSLFVAGASGSGVHISGKTGASMIRSIGYNGFINAISGATDPSYGTPGFVLYSGSIGSLLGTEETYSGVGLELFANTASYLRYKTANGGLLEVVTDKFFIGSQNIFLSSSNGNLEILFRELVDPGPPPEYLTKFHLDTQGVVTASAFYAFTGSSDSDAQVMVDTQIGLIDGKNIGRILYTSQRAANTTGDGGREFSNVASNSAIVLQNNPSYFWDPTEIIESERANTEGTYIKWSPLIPSTPVFILPFENTITLFGYAYRKFETKPNDRKNLLLAIQLKFSDPQTGSYAEFGAPTPGQGTTKNADYRFYRSIGTLSANTANVAYYQYQLVYRQQDESPLNVRDFTWSQEIGAPTDAKWVPFKATLEIPNRYTNKLVILDASIGFASTRRAPLSEGGTPPYNVGSDFRFSVKVNNIVILSGRNLFNNELTGLGG